MEEVRFYTVQEVAEILRIGRNKAYEMVKKEEIPSVKIGDSIRVPRADFDKKFGLAA
jgi:excisionase family DNA binding protein